MVVRAAQFLGGPHDGEVHEHPDPMPDKLFAITHKDGSRYARVGDRQVSGSEEVVGLFRFDPTSVLARQALNRLGLPPDTPCYGPPSPPPQRRE